MYTNGHSAVPAPQSRTVAPETFLLDQDAQQSLPPEAVLALQQVDNRKPPSPFVRTLPDLPAVKYFLISAPVDWQPEQVIRRFLLPTGEYISCVLWYVDSISIQPAS
jgi:transcription factor STE12